VVLKRAFVQKRKNNSAGGDGVGDAAAIALSQNFI
jgi:hypothetical protein